MPPSRTCWRNTGSSDIGLGALATSKGGVLLSNDGDIPIGDRAEGLERGRDARLRVHGAQQSRPKSGVLQSDRQVRHGARV